MTRCQRAALVFVVLAQLPGGVPPVVSPPAGSVRPPVGSLPSVQQPLPNPAPAVPPVVGPSVGGDLWVPSRIVPVPGEPGGLVVPGHWERRISPHETYIPPLTATTPDGRPVTIPGGIVRPPAERQAP